MPLGSTARELSDADKQTAQRLRSLLDVLRRDGCELNLEDFPHLEAVAEGRFDIEQARLALARGCSPQRLRDIFT